MGKKTFFIGFQAFHLEELPPITLVKTRIDKYRLIDEIDLFYLFLNRNFRLKIPLSTKKKGCDRIVLYPNRIYPYRIVPYRNRNRESVTVVVKLRYVCSAVRTRSPSRHFKHIKADLELNYFADVT